uniref:Uncharacterized protein n=1 Tax=viral metagenome TaxID=1070528 RepID=A0A6M3ILJ6_9ZZZZ
MAEWEITTPLDKVWASVEVTVNLGNYENIKIMGGYSRTIGPDDDPHELRKVMTRKIIKDVVQEGERVREEQNK